MTKNQVKLLQLVEETATHIESYSSTVNIWHSAQVSNPGTSVYYLCLDHAPDMVVL